MNSQVDLFFANAKKWKEEMILLRQIVLEFDLEEKLKWMHPCYSYKGGNVTLIHGFKEYCALLFFKGVLLTDDKNLLIQQTENVQDRRQIRFKNLSEIIQQTDVIKEYISQAIEIEKSGMKVRMKKTSEFNMPDELKKMLSKDSKLKAAFENLTPGRQRGYLLYFSSAKQSATRISRIEKLKPKIFEGKGLNE